MPRRDVGVSLVFRGDPEMTKAMVRDLMASDAAGHIASYVAVDNGSEDGSLADWLEEQGWRVIRNPANIGIFVARNQTYWRLAGECPDVAYILEVHADMRFQRRWFAPLRKAMADPEVWIASASIIRRFDAQILPNGVPMEPEKLDNAAVEAICALGRQGKVDLDPLARKFAHPCLYRMEPFKARGFYDDQYRWQEYADTDLYHDWINIQGRKAVVAPNSWAIHYTAAQRERYLNLDNRQANRERFCRKWGLPATANNDDICELVYGWNPKAVTSSVDACVVGLGYIGLPLAVLMARHRFRSLVGVDVREEHVERLRRGELPIGLREPGLEVSFAQVFQEIDFQLRPRPSDVFVLAVSTLTGDKLDLSYLEAAIASILPVLRQGNLVVVESTVPPDASGRIRRQFEDAGWRVGRDVFLAFAPERACPGDLVAEMANNPRLVGGMDDSSTREAIWFYRRFTVGPVIGCDARTACMVKLAENVFRDVNVALANTLLLACREVGADVWKVIELANQHPRVTYLRPGPGVGGHCIPLDPYFMMAAAPEHTALLGMARQVNDSMPLEIADWCKENLRPGARIVLFGWTYKAEVADTRLSPAIRLREHLEGYGFEVGVLDILVPQLCSYEPCRGAEIAILVTDHDFFRRVDPEYVGSLMASRHILDTRHALDAETWRKAGFTFTQFGADTTTRGEPWPASES